jgi:hypothetical protein
MKEYINKQETIRQLRSYWIDQQDEDYKGESYTPDWTFYGSLRFKAWTTHYNARRLLKKWLRGIEKQRYPCSFDWIAVIERRRRDSTIVYVLIGPGQEISRHHWNLRWRELAECDALLFGYHPGVFPDYVSKNALSDSKFKIGFDMNGWGADEIGGL